jgi:tryptophanase
MFGRPQPGGRNEIPSPRELVRLAFPRRVYTQSHFDYVIEVLGLVWRQRDAIPAYRITKQAPFLRHFTAHFALGGNAGAAGCLP